MEIESISVTIKRIKKVENGLSGKRMERKKLTVYIKMTFHGKVNLKIIITVMERLLRNILNITKVDRKRSKVVTLIIKKMVNGQSGMKMETKNM